jgi:hypothetical protein
MTLLRPQINVVTSIQPSVFSAPYWEGIAQSELRFQRCISCSLAIHTPAAICSQCHGADLRWEVSSGRGVLHSYTVVWRPVSPDFEVPYVPVLVLMEEGWTMLSALIDCEDSDAAIGLEVEVAFHLGADGAWLPYMRPRL